MDRIGPRQASNGAPKFLPTAGRFSGFQVPPRRSDGANRGCIVLDCPAIEAVGTGDWGSCAAGAAWRCQRVCGVKVKATSSWPSWRADVVDPCMSNRRECKLVRVGRALQVIIGSLVFACLDGAASSVFPKHPRIV